MKTLLSFITLLLISNFTYAQTTAIPDANFEQALINLGYDTAPINGSVLTSNISGVISLIIDNKNISDLTGIEDFTALTYLYCYDNQLTSINVTQNTALEYLQCSDNQLTSIDVTQNTALEYLNCDDNQLTSLDVTQNTALVSLSCDQNQLICLNMKNGNNSNFSSISTTNNPNLNCIEVDDVAYSNANWSPYIDAQTSFSTSCPNPCAVGIEENSLQNLSLYPNPSTGSITIDLEETKSNVSLSLTNALGQVVLTQNYKSTNHINFDLDAPKGLYFLRLETDGEVITKKILFN